MTTMGSMYGIPANPTSVKESSEFLSNRRVGVELEYENMSVHPSEFLDPGLWDITDDGSLRTINPGTMSLELRYRAAFGGVDSHRALISLNRYLKRDKGILVSERTGLHVHVDFRDVSTEQVRNFYLIYLLAEPFLYEYCGTNRDKNIFCLPMYRTPHLISNNLNVGRFIEGNAVGRTLGSMFKYSGLNFGALSKKGSVEFRMHPSTTDVDKVRLWINLLLRLTESGTASKINIRRTLKRLEGGANVVEEMFKDYYQHLASNNVIKNLETGIESLYAAACSKSRNSNVTAYYRKQSALEEYPEEVASISPTSRRISSSEYVNISPDAFTTAVMGRLSDWNVYRTDTTSTVAASDELNTSNQDEEEPNF